MNSLGLIQFPCWGLLGGNQPREHAWLLQGFAGFAPLFPVYQCSGYLTSEVNINGHILPLIFQIRATSSVKQLTLLPINPCQWRTLSPWSPQPGACVWKLLTAWLAPPPSPLVQPVGEQGWQGLTCQKLSARDTNPHASLLPAIQMKTLAYGSIFL